MYQYYNLPFCTPKEGKEYKTEDLGEVLEGDRLVNTPYRLAFRTDVDNQVLCQKTLNDKDLQKFREAVKQDYYFQVSWCSLSGSVCCSLLRGTWLKGWLICASVCVLQMFYDDLPVWGFIGKVEKIMQSGKHKRTQRQSVHVYRHSNSQLNRCIRLTRGRERCCSRIPSQYWPCFSDAI